jgi:hypothetical protein
MAVTYPVRVELDAPLEVARWRPFFNWVLAIPHLIISNVLTNVTGIVVFIGWFAILFTGKFPPGLFRFVAMSQRYQLRAVSHAIGLRETYPPFEFEMTSEDPGTDAAQYAVDEPEVLSRGLIFVKWLLAFPHYVALFFVVIGAFFAWIIGAFAVLFTGAWPQGIRDFLVGTARWGSRVTAYVYLMRDEYPPFSLD